MSFADTFFDTYPEFAGKIESATVEAIKKRVCVLYAVLRNGEGEPYVTATCMAVAHYIVRGGYAGIDMGGASGNPTGVLTGAGVGDISVSFQQKPIKDMFEDFFASTSYGQDFLAWLATVGGISYVN